MIYDCVAEPLGWHDVLGVLTDEFQGKIATLAVLDTATKASRFGAAYGDRAILDPLINTYAAEMPFYDVVPKCAIDVPVTMAQLSALHGPDGYELLLQSRLWTEWFVPHGLGDALCTNILKTGKRIGALVINVGRERQLISPSDIDRLSLIIPHVRRAVTIGDLFELERRKAELLRNTIDALDIAVLIVGDSMHLKYANPAAEALLAGNAGACAILGGRVTVADPRSRRALEESIAIGLRDESKLGSRAIGLPLPGAVPLIAHVLPLGDRRQALAYGEDAAAAIFIAMPGDSPEPALEAIAALFGLTGAERRVAAQVARGMNRHTIAAANQVSDGTVKSQLDSIYDKTGASNQRELEKLLRDLTPPLRKQL
jgi:DNA-binding CsgD family transcriptional regulator